MADRLKINVSFPQYDKHIYDFIKSQPNPSAFLRKLVEAYMGGQNVVMSPIIGMTQQMPYMGNMMPNIEPVEEEVEEDVEIFSHIQVDKSGKVNIEIDDGSEAIDDIPI